MLEEEMIERYKPIGPHTYNIASGLRYTLDEINHPSQDPAIAEMQQMVAKMYAHTFSREQTYKDMLFTTILDFCHKHCNTDTKVFVAVDVKTKNGKNTPFCVNGAILKMDEIEHFCEDFVSPTVEMILRNYQRQFGSSAISSMSVLVAKK